MTHIPPAKLYVYQGEQLKAVEEQNLSALLGKSRSFIVHGYSSSLGGSPQLWRNAPVALGLGSGQLVIAKRFNPFEPGIADTLTRLGGIEYPDIAYVGGEFNGRKMLVRGTYGSVRDHLGVDDLNFHNLFGSRRPVELFLESKVEETHPETGTFNPKNLDSTCATLFTLLDYPLVFLDALDDSQANAREVIGRAVYLSSEFGTEKGGLEQLRDTLELGQLKNSIDGDTLTYSLPASEQPVLAVVAGQYPVAFSIIDPRLYPPGDGMKSANIVAETVARQVFEHREGTVLTSNRKIERVVETGGKKLFRPD